MKIRIGLIILLIILFLSGYVYLVIVNIINFPDSISIGISLLALVISLISVFKNEIFPHDLNIYIDCFYLVRGNLMNSKGKNTIQIMPTLTFYNRGYGECPIRKIRIRVKPSKRSIEYIFLPAVEIDIEALMQQRKGVNASNTKGAYSGFVLEPKKSAIKTIVFVPRISQDSPNFFWVADMYKLEFQVQVHGTEKYKKYAEFDLDVTKSMLSMLLNNTGVLNIM